MLTNELKNELTQNIIPFWNMLKDSENGGFFGEVDKNARVNEKAVKGGILNSRILWFYSASAMLLNDKSLLEYAGHSYEFLKNSLWDNKYGGIYWSVNYDGTPCDENKHIYNQAFAIYALSQYYLASNNKEALQLAQTLFELIETKGVDSYGYLEQFDRQFNAIDNDKLSENGLMAEKTMNTMLHVLEAYTVLYEANKSEKVKGRILYLLNQFKNDVYNSNKQRLEVFFDKKLGVISDIHSYGHDIEASWLIDRAAQTIADEKIINEAYSYTNTLVENVLSEAYGNMSLANENDSGVQSETRVWWVQAEAIVGLINAYEKTGDEGYVAVALNIWEFIKKYLHHESGEWYWAVDKNGKKLDGRLADMWKCPYHNSRMCIEIIKRMGK